MESELKNPSHIVDQKFYDASPNRKIEPESAQITLKAVNSIKEHEEFQMFNQKSITSNIVARVASCAEEKGSLESNPRTSNRDNVLSFSLGDLPQTERRPV
jgi:hypothetical protein